MAAERDFPKPARYRPVSHLERHATLAYYLPMDDNPPNAPVPAGWLEALEESDADIAAGRIVSGDIVLRDLKDSLARLEAKDAVRPTRKSKRRH